MGRPTLVIPAVTGLEDLQRCCEALARTEVPTVADVVVVGLDPTGVETARWQPPFPAITMSQGLGDFETGNSDTGNYVLLLRPDTEPLPGFLDDLIATYDQARATTRSPLVVYPRTEIAPDTAGIPDDWPALSRNALPPQAALLNESDWRNALGFLASRDPNYLVADLIRVAATTVEASNACILSHRLATDGIRAQRELSYWNPEKAIGLVLTTAVDSPVGTAALTCWLQAAACDIPAAVEWLHRWQDLLAALPAEERQSLPRLIRRRDQLVADIIQESALQPEAAARARSALASDDRGEAVANLVDNPDSYAAAVAVVTLLGEGAKGHGRNGIPSTIVQGWFDSSPPEDALAVASSWPRNHPCWQYLFFDSGAAAEWIRAHLGDANERIFRTASPVGKSNLFRYAFLAECGGVWADIDDGSIAAIDPLLGDGSLIVVQETVGAIADNIILAAPGHPALIATRDEAFRNVADGFEESPWLANGPGLFTRKVAAWLAGLLPGETDKSGTVVLAGREISRYVSMHQPLHYKETPLAWDVTDDRAPAQRGSAAPIPLSRRQRSLRDNSNS